MLYTVRITKSRSLRGIIQVKGERLCSAVESLKHRGYVIENIRKVKE